ncbi:hypothetical protein HELRODRAFT_103632 [Helobdella robusta]|uniref:Argininosuccinate lyase n=1 Tax=Helobdella robusta TaxID=6412 RepID=T1EDG7_HELRO|nr:hypothetical protein HELRODRAFT_103632 [Helobdella robusta]ESN93254.1 hypothetical protein HELRODRAFT_103632 [Helobdella robusta]
MWSGRFERASNHHLMKTFNSSFHLDKRLYEEDIMCSIAYARGQFEAGLISKDDSESIENGLKKIKEEWEEGVFPVHEGQVDEDIHSAHERRLKATYFIRSRLGGSLQRGRSRNDQVATDMLLWLRKSSENIVNTIIQLIRICLDKAKTHIHIIMPGYTHLQKAQPIRWSHMMLSYVAMFERDLARLKYFQASINECPLGSGALSGNAFNMNRERMAGWLNFSRVSVNSIETVGNRDFVADFLYWASMFSIHCSRLSEDFILFSTREFKFVKLSEQFSTGSSLMPQKKNPDSLELVRGKCGQIMGKCFGFLTTMKGLPSSYSKDLQEDKQAMFDVHDCVLNIIEIIKGVIESLQINEESCVNALSPELLATDLAYYLTKKGVAFRDAHFIVGQLVLKAEQLHCEISQLSLDQLQTISSHFSEDVKNIWNYERSVEQYKSTGGTSISAIQAQINYFEEMINL